MKHQQYKQLNKKHIAIALILTLCISVLMPISADAQIDSPKLVISSQYKMPTFKAGEQVRFAIPVRNEGNQDAFDIYASLNASTDPSIYPFEIENMIPKVRSSMIHAGFSDDIALYLKVSPKAENKIYPLQINLEYKATNGSGGNTYTETETIYVKIDNEIESPKVKIHRTNIVNDTLYSGETGEINLDIQNEGNATAKDIKVQLAGFSPTTMYLEGLNRDTQTLNSLEAKHFNNSTNFNVTVSPELATGIYNLDVIIEYKDAYDKTYKEQTKIYVPVEKKDANEEAAQLVIENTKYPTNEVAAETDFTVSFSLRNNSDQDAKNIKVTVNGGTEILPKSMSIQSIAALKAGEVKPLSFTLFSRETTETKNYPIQITVEYETDTSNNKNNSSNGDKNHSFTQYVGVLIKGKDEEKDKQKMTPKLILENYAMDQSYAQAGVDFGLNISLLNTHSSEAIQNITVNFSAEGDVFSPVNSSNTFYIDKVGAGQSIQRGLTLRPTIDAAFKTHNLHLDIKYEDSDGKAYETREVIGIPVMQEVQLEVGQIELPPEAMMGNPIAISTQFYNTGRATIRNLTVRLEGEFDTIDRSIYFGNVEPGKNSYYDVTITPTQPGEVVGKVVFDFLDPIDQRHTIEREFSIALTEWQDPYMEGPMFPGEMPTGEMPTESNKAIYFYIGGGVLALLVVGFLIYKRRKRQKELEEVELNA